MKEQTLPTENLLEDTDGLRRPPFYPSVPSRCGSRLLLLTCAPLMTSSHSEGTVNFITGAGGFLQSALFGSSGMRLVSDKLTFDPPPPSASGGKATMMGIRTMHYHGSQISRQVRENTVTTCLVKAGQIPLMLTDVESGTSQRLQEGVPLIHSRGKSTISLAAAT